MKSWLASAPQWPPGQARSAWLAGLGVVILGTAALAIADRIAATAELETSTRRSEAMLQHFETREGRGSAMAHAASRLVVRNLWPKSPLQIQVALATGRQGCDEVCVYANDELLARGLVRARTTVFRAPRARGPITLRFEYSAAPAL